MNDKKRTMLAGIIIFIILLFFSTPRNHDKVESKQSSVPVKFQQLNGTYSVSFLQIKDSDTISQTNGSLVLIPTSKNDKSPRTGESPSLNEDRGQIPYYGWIDADLSKVNAPLPKDDGVSPIHTSKDPIYPGVLFYIRKYYSDSSKQADLWVSSVFNLRNDEEWLDGAGFVMQLDSIDSNGFYGEWRPAGKLRGGKGIYSARKVE